MNQPARQPATETGLYAALAPLRERSDIRSPALETYSHLWFGVRGQSGRLEVTAAVLSRELGIPRDTLRKRLERLKQLCLVNVMEMQGTRWVLWIHPPDRVAPQPSRDPQLLLWADSDRPPRGKDSVESSGRRKNSAESLPLSPPPASCATAGDITTCAPSSTAGDAGNSGLARDVLTSTSKKLTLTRDPLPLPKNTTSGAAISEDGEPVKFSAAMLDLIAAVNDPERLYDERECLAARIRCSVNDDPLLSEAVVQHVVSLVLGGRLSAEKLATTLGRMVRGRDGQGDLIRKPRNFLIVTLRAHCLKLDGDPLKNWPFGRKA